MVLSESQEKTLKDALQVLRELKTQPAVDLEQLEVTINCLESTFADLRADELDST